MQEPVDRRFRYRKRLEIEARLGLTIPEYVIAAAEQGMSQAEMCKELGVQAVTLGKWIEREGLVLVRTYRRARKVA